MKIYGFFRGFPGLGRVMSGISILTMLREAGHEVKAYSYFQGVQPLMDHNIEFMMEEQPCEYHVTAIGLNPISRTAAELIRIICADAPDLVIVDGEALFVSTLAMVFPRERILSLLNPMDLHNVTLPLSTMKFYHAHYLAAGSAIVHGIDRERIQIPEDTHGCEIMRINTILRQEVLDTTVSAGTEIVSVLGGGTRNASELFLRTTLEMGKHILEAANALKEERFAIYCNDEHLAGMLAECTVPGNVRIVSEYASPHAIYSDAKIVICRAGRNTISEILYLGLPAILMASGGDFRSAEQTKNIEQVCMLRPGRILPLNPEDDGHALAGKLCQAMLHADSGYVFTPGNHEALKFILTRAMR